MSQSQFSDINIHFVIPSHYASHKECSPEMRAAYKVFVNNFFNFFKLFFLHKSIKIML